MAHKYKRRTIGEAALLAQKLFRSQAALHLTQEEIEEFNRSGRFISDLPRHKWETTVGAPVTAHDFYEYQMHKPSDAYPYVEKIYAVILVTRNRDSEACYAQWKPALISNDKRPQESAQPSTDADIAEIELALGVKLRGAYANYLKFTTEFPRGDGLLLYGADAIVERNNTFGVQEYLPRFVLIGDDSGGRGFLVKDALLSDARVYFSDLGCLFEEEQLAELAASFECWREDGLPLPK